MCHLSIRPTITNQFYLKQIVPLLSGDATPKYGWKDKNHGKQNSSYLQSYMCKTTQEQFTNWFFICIRLPRGSIVFPDVDDLDDPGEVALVLQGALNRRRARQYTRTPYEGASSQSSQPKNKKPKSRRSSLVGTQEERLKETPIEPATVVLNDEKEANNEEDSLQLDAQPGELQNLPAEEVQVLQGNGLG